MADYIEREQVYKSLYANADGEQSFDMASARVGAYERIEAIPSADVQPVVHGHWIVQRGNYNEKFECSVCQHISKDGGNYCSHCGADMRGESDG